MEFCQIPEDVSKVKDGCGVVHVGFWDGLGRMGVALASKEVGVEGTSSVVIEQGKRRRC